MIRVKMINTVKGFILAKPELADNDVDLLWAIWSWELGQLKPPKKIEKLTARDLMNCWKEGLISSPFSVSRSRRKCQQHYPETRGKAYDAKHKHQKRIKEDVKRATDQASRNVAERDSNTRSKST
tara:strand:+ start:647 stop:1021 length:375 start_codon:yes stop_codon:yes gene_type:complete